MNKQTDEQTDEQKGEQTDEQTDEERSEERSEETNEETDDIGCSAVVLRAMDQRHWPSDRGHKRTEGFRSVGMEKNGEKSTGLNIK